MLGTVHGDVHMKKTHIDETFDTKEQIDFLENIIAILVLQAGGKLVVSKETWNSLQGSCSEVVFVQSVAFMTSSFFNDKKARGS